MDASQALADLTEISAQIEAAVILDSAGAVVASSTADTGRAEVLARTAGDLLGAAQESTGGTGGANERLVQLQAALSDGCVFVVRDEDRVVAAVTAPDPTVGLVFYDLKTCLRHAAGEELAPKPKARQGSKKAQAAAKDSEEDSTNGSG